MDGKAVVPIRARFDGDTHPNNTRQGDALDAINLRYDQQGGTVTDVLGMNVVPNASIPAGNFALVGVLSVRDFVFRLIVNASNRHQIWKLTVSTGVHELVLDDDKLNFNKEHWHKLNYDHDRDILYWSNGYWRAWTLNANLDQDYNPPRKIRVQKAIYYTASAGANPLGYPSFDWQTMDVIKYPPKFSPSVEYYSNTDRKTNFLFGRLYEFMYQYIYEDGEPSKFSHVSRLRLPLSSDSASGKNPTNASADNELHLTINTGHHTVDRIRVAVRMGNTGPWGIFAELNKDELGLSDNANQTVKFYGDEAITILGSNEVIVPFDLVPQTANTQEIVALDESSALVYGGCREGFDRVTTNWRNAVGFRKVNYINPNPILIEGVVTDILRLDFSNYSGYFSILPWAVGWSFTLTSANANGFPYYPSGVGPTTERIKPTIVATEDLLIAAMIGSGSAQLDYVLAYLVHDQLVNVHGMLFATHTPGTSIIDIPGPDFGGFGPQDLPSLPSSGNTVVTGFKSGAQHLFAVEYSDRANRNGSAYINEQHLRINVQAFNEVNWEDLSIGDTDRAVARITLAIRHRPPDWAKYWRILYAGNTKHEDFQQIVATHIETASSNRLKLTLDAYYMAEYKGAVINHEIQKGDIVSFITEFIQNVDPAVDPNYSQQIEAQVLEYSLTGGVNGAPCIYIEYFDYVNLVFGGVAGNNGCLIEISTRKKETDKVTYHPIGHEYEILSPHTTGCYHQGMNLTDIPVREFVIAGSEVILHGYYLWFNTIAGKTFTITGSAGNNGTYTISDVTYDAANDLTTLITVEVISANEGPSVVGMLAINFDQSTNLSVFGVVHIDQGDIYFRRREYKTGHPMADPRPTYTHWIEDYHFSDYFTSRSYPKGWTNVFNPFFKMQVIPGLMRNSLRNREDGDYNGMSTFEFVNQRRVSERFGLISGLEQVGYTLRVYQPDKCHGISIDRNTIILADGSTQQVISNKILGESNPDVEIYGTSHKESILRVGSSVFFYDGKRGLPIKDSNGGSFNLAAQGSGAFRLFQGSNLLAAGRKVHVGHDRRNSEVVFAFSNLSVQLDSVGDFEGRFSIAYNYTKNEWRSKYTYHCDGFATGNDDVFYVLRGKEIYEMNVGKPRDFFGTRHDAEIWLVVNEMPVVKKLMQTIEVACSEPWDIYEILSDDESDMQSQIPVVVQKINEGTYYAAYLRDENSPGTFIGVEDALVNGRPLRGLYFIHKFKRSGNSDSLIMLRYFQSRFTISEIV